MPVSVAIALARRGRRQWAAFARHRARRGRRRPDDEGDRAHRSSRSVSPSHVIGPFDIHHVRNTGIAFALFPGAASPVTILTGIAVIWMLVYFARSGARHPILPVALGFLVGGSMSNLVDRVRQGYVTDFIAPQHWPTFNLGDTFITVGVILLIASSSSSSAAQAGVHRTQAVRSRRTDVRAGLIRPDRPARAGRRSSRRPRRRLELAVPAGGGRRAARPLPGRASGPSARGPRPSGCSQRAGRSWTAGRSQRATGSRRRDACARRPPSADSPSSSPRSSTLTVALRGRPPPRRRQARRTSSCTHPQGTRRGTLVHGLLGRGIAGGGGARAAGHRAPARPRHLGPARGRARRRDAPTAAAADPPAGARPRVPRARPGPAPLVARHGSRRRSAVTAATRPASRSTPTPARGGHALRGRRASAAARAPACPTGDGANAPDPGSPGGDRPARLGRSGLRRDGRPRPRRASSCTPHGSPSPTRSRASGSTSSRRCPPTSRRRSNVRAARSVRLRAHVHVRRKRLSGSYLA